MPHDFRISRDSKSCSSQSILKTVFLCSGRTKSSRFFWDEINEARKSAGLLLFAYAIMIDQLHQITDQPKPISEVLRVLKGITACRVIDYLKERNYSGLLNFRKEVRDRNYRYSLWQTEKNVYPIFSEGLFMQTVNSIHNNPVRAGMVEKGTTNGRARTCRNLRNFSPAHTS